MGSNGRTVAWAEATLAQLAITASAATSSLIADIEFTRDPDSLIAVMAIVIAQTAISCQAATVTTTARTRLSPEARRAQIIEAAISAYERRPWDEISFEALAGEIGVSPPLLRHYFGAKRDLFLATVRHLGDLLTGVLTGERPDVPPDLLPRARLDDYLAFVEEHGWAHPLWLTAAADPDASATIDDLREDLARIILGRPIDEAPPILQLRTWGWMGFVESVITRHLEDREAVEREAVLDLLVGSMSILRAPRPRGRG
jgi:AcrR family transcriptional regulator